MSRSSRVSLMLCHSMIYDLTFAYVAYVKLVHSVRAGGGERMFTLTFLAPS